MGSPIANSSNYKGILCIEKHGELCLLLSKMLNADKVKVSHAKDTGQAADYLQDRQPEMVVIENNFFENAGILYVAQLKAMLPGTKVIMLSAQDGAKKEASRNDGVDVFLTNPFTKMQLVESVVSLINDSGTK